MAYRGGNKGGRGGRGRGGRGRGGPPFKGPRDTINGKSHLLLCKNFMSGSPCYGSPCSFDHAIQMHKEIVNSDPDPSQKARYDNGHRGYSRGGYNAESSSAKSHLFPSSDVALWNDSSGILKIFTSSHDGHWRLFNASRGFKQEVQHNMAGKISKIMVESNFLFCGFEGTSIKIPNVNVGMIHAWNLGTPGDPPIELHMHETAPFAHAGGVSCFITKEDMCVSGGHDDVIRVWKYDSSMHDRKGGFKLIQECCGHAGEITGMLMVGTMLWTCSTDRTIRLWESSANWECKYLITENTQPSGTAPTPPSSQTSSGVGHKDAITGLIAFESQPGNYVLSCSLDGFIKIWDSTNGECLSSTNHGIGLLTIALGADGKGNAILIVGTVDGRIFLRSLLQTTKTAPMCFLSSIDGCYTGCGHTASLPIRSIKAGPSGTFYTAGDDGKVCVWQLSGDLKLN